VSLLIEQLSALHNNIPWLKDRIILLVRHGSHAYGLNIEGSDEDVKGVCVSPLENRIGLHKPFEQAQAATPVDHVIYDAQKFIQLCSDNNPNISEVLWVDKSDVLYLSPLGEKLIAFRDKMLSKRIRWSFGGFAHDRLKELQTKRGWLLNPPKAPPTREEFGVAAYEKDHNKLTQALSEIEAKIGTWNLGLDELSYAEKIRIKQKIKEALLEATEGNLLRSAASLIGFSDDLIFLLEKEKAYRNKLKDWKNYQSWLVNRNEKRAALEAKIGYDSKDACHLHRLQNVAIEALRDRVINVKRTIDKDYLLKIRLGEVIYENMMTKVEEDMKKMDEAYKESTLPERPNMQEVNKFCVELLQTNF
jgi:predicted nucleotidyltransferase